MNDSSMIANRLKLTDTTLPVPAGGGEFQATGSFLDNDTVTIGVKTYTFQTVLTNVDGNIQIAGISGTWLNLERAMKLIGTPGTDYAAATVIHPTASGIVDPGDDTFFDVAARLAGVEGNNILLSESLTNGIVTSQMFGGISADTWMDFRKITRRPARLAVNEYEIFEPDDFLKNPGNSIDGLVINLASGKYVVKDSIVSNLELNWAPGADITIFFESSALTWEYTGSNTFISVPATGLVDIQNGRFLLSGNNATFFNTLGLSFFILKDSFVTFTGTGGTVGTNSFGNDIGILSCSIEGFETGVIWDNCVFVSSFNTSYQTNFADTSPILSVTGKLFFASLFDTLVLISGPSGNAFFINPNLGAGVTLNIENVGQLGAGTYFEAGPTGVITSFADSSIGATAIDTVSSGTAIPGGGNYARFNHSGPDVFVGQRVINSTFTPETTYNETILVTLTGAGFFEGNVESTTAALPFTNNDSGSYLSNSATVTSASHGQGDGQSLLIKNSINFNSGISIYNSLTNTFQMNLTGVFPGSETVGDWDAGSLTEKDKRLNLRQNGKQKDSFTTGGWSQMEPMATWT